MPILPDQFRTGGAVQGKVASSLLASRDAASELGPGDRVGLFRIVREIGRGGMAIVYLAERDDGEYRQQVALKWMRGALLAADGEALFRRERQALADLRHPHIARLLDGGRAEAGRPWFAMELIEGERLDRHCVERALPLRQRLELFVQLCAAVGYAHARGVIHSDIKPSNVLVEEQGGVKLLDFGIARLAGESDGLGEGAFTPGFASPEQLRRESLTTASDVFQLGRLLGSLLCADRDEQATVLGATLGREPVGTGCEAATLATVGDATAAGQLPARLPADLAAILGRATAAEPERRYTGAEALAADLRAFLDHRPVAARPQRAGYLAGRFLRRHPLGTGLAALALALLVASSTWFSLRLREQRDLARAERNIAELERDRARQALETTAAINRFLNEDLLDAANPLNRPPGAPEVTVRQAMDAAEARLDARLADHPAVLATLLTTQGELRFEFGDDDRAMALYDRAIELARATPGAEDTAIRARGLRAALLITLQDHERAQRELAALLDDAARRYGREDLRTLEVELRLLEARARQGSDPGQVEALRELRRGIDASAGGAHRLAGEASLLAAMSLVFAGRANEAANDARQAHETLREAAGEDHPGTLKALVTLGHVHRAGGRDDEAVASMRRALELQRARYGPDALDSLFMQNELAYTLSALGRQQAAEPLFEDLAQRYRNSPMSTPTQLANTLSNLAVARLRDDRPGDALASFDEAIALMEGASGVLPQVATNLHRGRADALLALQRLDEAARSLDRAAATAAALEPADWRRLMVDGSQARLLLARGDRTAGLALLERTLAKLGQVVSTDHAGLRSLQALRAQQADPQPANAGSR